MTSKKKKIYRKKKKVLSGSYDRLQIAHSIRNAAALKAQGLMCCEQSMSGHVRQNNVDKFTGFTVLPDVGRRQSQRLFQPS
ncbi:uncharacterized protein FOMMEDRAFT_21064 [Fomitiporia mediterranea MF3/22]|uniref:uncharacterized protein n=1 Tax=Fomitiporia mediterranea (strain MF3/22) TaxID=694068 RepID=UPI000440791F|nr:uncharacterized protein FOMMEDRAFT_21064 [Fomitiporia mediterranea MF3/22]EJD02323.1 hypothetical protein FOMMEDRAFT_21064 [Fomitiporia mediterranea MF3/22]